MNLSLLTVSIYLLLIVHIFYFKGVNLIPNLFLIFVGLIINYNSIPKSVFGILISIVFLFILPSIDKSIFIKNKIEKKEQNKSILYFFFVGIGAILGYEKFIGFIFIYFIIYFLSDFISKYIDKINIKNKECTRIIISLVSTLFINEYIYILLHKYIFIVLLLGFLYSCYTDLKYTMIKNYITFPLMIIGLEYNFINNNMLSSILGILVVLLFLFLGMGDVKLLMAVGSIVGYEKNLDIIILSMFLSLLFSIFNKSFFLSIKNLYYKFIFVILLKTNDLKEFTNIDKTKAHKVKMAIPITIAVIIKLFYVKEDYVLNFIKSNSANLIYLIISVIIFSLPYILKTVKKLNIKEKEV